MNKLLKRLMRLFGLKPKKSASDVAGYNVRLFSVMLNNNDPVCYTTPGLELQGLYVRANPDGSEDLVRKTSNGLIFVKQRCGPGEGKFNYLITKKSKRGDYDYLKAQKSIVAETAARKEKKEL